MKPKEPRYADDAAMTAGLLLSATLYEQEVRQWMPISTGYARRLLHATGCPHLNPLYGWMPGRGPRCRLCGTVADLPTVLMWEALLNWRNAWSRKQGKS